MLVKKMAPFIIKGENSCTPKLNYNITETVTYIILIASDELNILSKFKIRLLCHESIFSTFLIICPLTLSEPLVLIFEKVYIHMCN